MKNILKFLFFLNLLFLLIGCSGTADKPTTDSNRKDFKAAIRAIHNQDLNDLRSIINKNKAILNDIEDSKGNTLLNVAVIEGHIEIVKYLVSDGADLNQQDSSEETPLIIAIKEGKLDLIAYFLSQDADVNVKVYFNDTPLHKAVDKGDLEIVKLVVTNGADLNLKNNQKETPLFVAVESNQTNVAEYLISQNGDSTKFINLFLSTRHSLTDISFSLISSFRVIISSLYSSTLQLLLSLMILPNSFCKMFSFVLSS